MDIIKFLEMNLDQMDSLSDDQREEAIVLCVKMQDVLRGASNGAVMGAIIVILALMAADREASMEEMVRRN